MSRAWPSSRAQAHLEALAGDLVDIEWVASIEAAEASPNTHVPMIWTPKPTSAIRYLVGLHELGHVMHPQAVALNRSKKQDDRLAGEAYAWAWARQHTGHFAKDFLTHRVWHAVAELLVTHLS